MRYETQMKLAKGTMIFCLITLAFVVGHGIGAGVLTLSNVQNLVGLQPTNLTCANLTLENTAHCLNNELSSWWRYNITNTNKTLSETELKAMGGVCAHASKWYVEKAKSLGFTGQEVKFWGDSDIGHDIALIYDKNLTGYCLIDQQNIIGCSLLETLNTIPKHLNTLNISI